MKKLIRFLLVLALITGVFYLGMFLAQYCSFNLVCHFEPGAFNMNSIEKFFNESWSKVNFGNMEIVQSPTQPTGKDSTLEIEIPSPSKPYTKYVGIAFANNQGKAEKLAQKLSSSAQFTDVGRTLGYKDALSLVPEKIDSIQVACTIGEKDKLFTGTDKSDMVGLKCVSGIITYSKTYANGLPSN